METDLVMTTCMIMRIISVEFTLLEAGLAFVGPQAEISAVFRSYRDSSEPQYLRYDSSFLVVNKKPSTMFHKTIMPNFFICLKPPLPLLQVPPQAHRDVHVLHHHPSASPLEEAISAHSVSHLFLHAPPSPTKLDT